MPEFKLYPNFSEKNWKQIVARILVFIVLTIVILVMFVYFFENSIIYHPVKYPDGNWDPPGLGTAFFDVSIEGKDGEQIHGWWAPREDTEKTILWFHGNAGNITHRASGLRMFHEMGAQVLLIDYRGYGKSDGSPSEKGFYQDGMAAMQYLLDKKGISPRNLYVLGRSLGGAVATRVVSEQKVGGLILVSAFPSVADMVPYVFPIPYLHLIVRHDFNSEKRIDKIQTPLLMLHGEHDNIVPLKLGKKLFESAGEPKTFRTLPGAGHNNIESVAGSEYVNHIKEFMFGRDGTSE